MLVIPVLDLYMPTIYGKLFDSQSKKLMYNNIYKILFIFIGLQVFGELNSLNSDLQYFKFNNDINYVIMENILKGDTSSNNAQLYSSTILSTIHRLQDIVKDWYFLVQRFIIPHVIFLVVSIIYLSYFSIYLGLCMILLFSSNLTLIFASAKKCRSYTLKMGESFDRIIEEMEDIILNLQSVQSENKEDHEMDLIRKLSDEYEEASYDMIKCYIKFRTIGNVLFCLFLIGMLTISYHLYNTNKIKMSNMVTIFFIIRQNQASNKRILSIIENTAYDYGVAHKNQDLMKINQKQRNLAIHPVKINKIEFKNVYFKYPGSKYILQDISLTINKGDKIVFIGDVGAGKSTLLKLVLKLLKPNGGTIKINNTHLDNMDMIQLFSSVGYMPQSPILFNRSILDNIRYGHEHISQNDVIKLLKEFNVYDTFSNMPNGLDTKIGKEGTKISGGQRQIIWFLRIYLKDPSLIILDEPTASLDKASKNTMSKLIEKVLQDKTFLMVSHDEFLIKFANRRVRVEQNKIAADDVIDHNQDYEEQFSLNY